MADSCCNSENIGSLHKSQSKTLWIVLVINGVMFFVELSSGIYAQSLALIGDSLDMLGDFLAYGVSLYVVHRGASAKIKAAQFKAVLILLAGLGVFGQAVYRVVDRQIPEFEIMGIVGFIVLVANLFCLYLLTKHKNDDINFKSVWLCSRNDIIANVSVLLAAGVVFLTNSPWPDLIVGMGILFVFFRSALFILKEAKNNRANPS